VLEHAPPLGVEVGDHVLVPDVEDHAWRQRFLRSTSIRAGASEYRHPRHRDKDDSSYRLRPESDLQPFLFTFVHLLQIC